MVGLQEVLLFWLPVVILLPLALATLVALPFWLRRRAIFGNVVGSCVVAAVIFVLVWQQYGAFVQAQTACVNQTADCPPGLQLPYLQYLVMVLLGWVDVFFLLIFSGMVEDRQKRRRLDRSRL
jgi:uncharacterized RDD family membrane protein YckC